MTQKKIWIVTELFYPEETAVAFIFTRIANFLAASYEVNVICGPEFYDNNKKAFFDNLQISGDITIHRINSINLDKNSLVQRSLKLLLISFRMGFSMIRNISRGNIVILSTNPAPLLLLAGIIKFIKKIQLHILVHDVFPENTVPAKIFKSDRSVVYRSLKSLYDKSYSCADHLIVIGSDMKIVMSCKVDRFKRKPIISIVPNWTNPDKFAYQVTEKNDGNQLVLQYAGNTGRVQGLEEILEAFRISNNTNLCLKINGNGALYPYIETYIRDNGINNIILKGSYSRDEESNILSGCDIGIVSLSEGMFGLGVPSKSYHLLSAGKPILYIGEPETEISQLVINNSIGWSLDIGNQREVVEFLKNASGLDKDLLTSMGRKARSLAEKEYNEPVILKLLQTKIESISSK